MPSRGWYGVGVVLVLVGVVGAVLLGLAAVDLARDAKVTRLPADGALTVPDHRFAVWVSADVPPGTTGAELGVACALTPQGGPTAEVPPLRNQSASVGSWHLVALSAKDSLRGWEGTPATLACDAQNEWLVGPVWGTGKQPQVLGVLALAAGALVVGTGGVVLGAGAALLVWFLRRRRASRQPTA